MRHYSVIARAFKGRFTSKEWLGNHTFDELQLDASSLAGQIPPMGATGAIGRPSGTVSGAGEKIGMLMPRNHGYSFAVGLFGIWNANGTAVLLSPEDPPSRMAHILKDSGARCLVVHPSLEAKVSSLDAVKVSSEARGPPLGLTGQSNADALMIYTSGTTGNPKGVVLSADNLIASMESMISAWKWTANDKIYHTLPLHHVHGLVNILLTSIWAGASCEFYSHERFDASLIWQEWIATKDLSLFMAVPTIYKKLVDCFDEMSPQEQAHATAACSQFRLMVSGSSALPEPLFQKWNQVSGHELLERYGMTETGMILGNPMDGPRLPGEVGVPFPGVQVKLVNDDFQESNSGKLLVKGPQIFKSYWNLPKATQESFHEDWFVTGDVAELTPRGTYKILGRESADIIKSRGYKISALEIERDIAALESVSEVAVLGVPSEDQGEAIAALIVLKNAEIPLTLKSLQTHLEKTLPRYRIPTILKLVSEIPKNAMGKVNKKSLKSLF